MPSDDGRLIARGATTPGNADDDARRAAEACEIVEQLRVDFKERDDLCRRVDDITFMANDVYVPDAYQATAVKVHSPMASHIANTITAALSVNQPQVQFTPLKDWQSYVRNATLREHFFRASWQRQEQEAKRRLFRLFMWSVVTRGEGILKTLPRAKRAWAGYDAYSKKLRSQLSDPKDEQYIADEDAREEVHDAMTEDYKKGAPYPITTTDVLPETFYPMRTEDGISYAAEVKEVPYLEALDRYLDRYGKNKYGLNKKGDVCPAAMALPRAQWREAMHGKTTLTMVESWLWNECVYVLMGPGQRARGKRFGRGTTVKVVPHTYGNRWTKTLNGPYFHALGITTASRLPHRAGMSVLFPFLDLFPLLDSLLTVKGNAAFLFGFPGFKEKSGGGENKRKPAPYGQDGTEKDNDLERIEPGMVYPADIEPIEMPRGSPALEQLILEIKGFLEYALPSVVQGMTGGDPSGYAINQAAYLARLGWDPLVDNSEFALSDRQGFESWLIENVIREPVYARGMMPPQGSRFRPSRKKGYLCIGKDDLNGVHDYDVKLKPETPANRVIEIRSQAEMVDNKFTTLAMAREELGQNADEVELGLLFEGLKSDPAILDKVKERTFEKLGTIDRKALLGKANQPDLTAPENGAAGTPMPPGGPSGAPMGEVFQPGLAGQPLQVQAADGGGASSPGLGAMAPRIQGPPAAHQALPGQG